MEDMIHFRALSQIDTPKQSISRLGFRKDAPLSFVKFNHNIMMNVYRKL